MVNYREISSYPKLIRDLAYHFDFDLGRSTGDHSWVTLNPPFKYDALAGDSTGGLFLAYGNGRLEERPVLYVSSEGQVGKIADNLDAALGVILMLPHWMDVLKFSDGGELSAMRKTAAGLGEVNEEDNPDLPEVRDRIFTELQLTKPNDPVALLHAAVLQTDCTVIAKDGWKYESLFGGFHAR
jgi:hypothetical protein